MSWLNWLKNVKADGLDPNEFAREVYADTWLKTEFQATDKDRAAAWDLYVEMRTRITTEPLHYRSGDEATALTSVAALFAFTRDTLHKQQVDCRNFAVLATGMLNGVVRPFTAKWHKRKEAGAFDTEDNCHEFRAELKQLQVKLRWFQAVLGKLAEGDKFVLGSETSPLSLRDLDRDGESVPRSEVPAKVAAQKETANIRDWWPPAAKDRRDMLLAELNEPAQSTVFIDFPDRVDVETKKAIAQVEDNAVQDRRKEATKRYELATDHRWNTVGLAISGGGIRSATFALGVLQRLAHAGLLREVDYLSTVSGGGYIGSFLSSYLNSPNQAAPSAKKGKQDSHASSLGLAAGQSPFGAPDLAESLAVRWMRNHSKYLTFGGLIRRLQILGLAIYGVVINVFLLVPLVAFAVLLTSWTYGNELAAFKQKSAMPIYPAAGWPSWLLMASLVIAGTIGLVLGPLQMSGHRSNKRAVTGLQKWVEFAGTWIVPIVLVIAALNLIPTLVWGTHRGVAWLREGKAEHFVFNNQSVLIAAVSAAAPVISALASFATQKRKFVGLLAKLAFAISGPAYFVMQYLLLVEWHVVRGGEGATVFSSGIWLLILLVAPAVYGLWLVNVNFVAPHRFYRNRLAEAYQVQAGHPNSKPVNAKLSKQDIRAVDAQKLSELRNKNAAAPIHLINAAVNLPGSDDPDLRGRDSDFFLFSQCYCGSVVTGYAKTAVFEEQDWHMDLGTAVAISGAAASPHMAMNTVKWASFWMTLLNIRLSYWAANPGAKGRHKFYRDWMPANAVCLLRELLGWMNAKTARVNLTDGGHIENLGVYELLRRRCRFIVAIDGEQDGTLDCPSLHILIRHAAIDLNADIRFPDLQELKPNEKGWSHAHFALGVVRYQPRPGQPKDQHDIGFILYIKSSVTGNEPSTVLEYRRLNPDFPHQSTADQFFEEDQFEAYRALGYHIASEALREEIVGTTGKSDWLVRDWFEKLVTNLLSD